MHNITKQHHRYKNNVNLFQVAINAPEPVEVNYTTIYSPVFHYVDVNDEEDPHKTGILEVKVDSPDEDICAVVSVQPYSCPIVEELGGLSGGQQNVTFQTMLKSSAFIIRKSDYRAGFFLVLKVLEDGICKSSNTGTNAGDSTYLQKSFSFSVKTIQENLDAEGYGTLFTFVIIFLIVVAGLAVSGYLRLKEDKSKGLSKDERERRSNLILEEDPITTQSIMVSQSNVTDVTEIDGMNSTGTRATRTKAKYVNELSTKALSGRTIRKVKAMFQSNDMYIWLVVTMGISYAIPALQLVLKYQEEAAETGNLDLCYYNFQCAFPAGKLADFNHFLSNIGYVAFGLTFIVITKYKSWRYQSNKLLNVFEVERDAGVKHHQIIHKVHFNSNS